MQTSNITVKTHIISKKQFLFEHNIPLIDIRAHLLVEEKNPMDFYPFGLSGHFNIKGYQKIARVIFLETNKK